MCEPFGCDVCRTATASHHYIDRMFAYLVAGLIVGGLVWYLRRQPGDPPLGVQLGVGVVAAGIAGLLVNVLVDEDFLAITAWGFAASAIAAFAVLSLVQARARRGGAQPGRDEHSLDG